jgi:hypothetical protein
MLSDSHSTRSGSRSGVSVAVVGAGPFADAYAPLLQCVSFWLPCSRSLHRDHVHSLLVQPHNLMSGAALLNRRS